MSNAAQAAPATAGNHYEQHLESLYQRLSELYDDHHSHPVAALRLVGAGHSRGGRICRLNDRCDALANVTTEMILAEFPPSTIIDSFLDAGLLDLRFPAAAHTARDALREAVLFDAESNRLFPRGSISPVDPATTR